MIAVIVPIGIGGLVAFALWVWAVLDCIATDSILVRNLPKQLWIFVVIFVPTVGAIAWLLLGRPEHAGLSLGASNYAPKDYTKRRPARGFEDSAAWDDAKDQIPRVPPSEPSESAAAKERRLQEWEATLAAREAALDDDGGE